MNFFELVSRHTPSIRVLLAPLLKLLDEIELRLEQMIAKLNSIAEVQIGLGLAVIGSPFGETFAVRVSVRREIDPVVRHHFGQFVIGLRGRC